VNNMRQQLLSSDDGETRGGASTSPDRLNDSTSRMATGRQGQEMVRKT
jgi:hypothetical protein